MLYQLFLISTLVCLPSWSGADHSLTRDEIAKLQHPSAIDSEIHCVTETDCAGKPGTACVNGQCKAMPIFPPAVPAPPATTPTTTTEEQEEGDDVEREAMEGTRRRKPRSSLAAAIKDETPSTLNPHGEGALLESGEIGTSNSTSEPVRAYAFCGSSGYSCVETSCELQKADGLKGNNSGLVVGDKLANDEHYCRYFWALFNRCGHCVAIDG